MDNSFNAVTVSDMLDPLSCLMYVTAFAVGIYLGLGLALVAVGACLGYLVYRSYCAS